MTDAWDVFHSERLEVDRAVPAATVRARLRAGTLTPDDLVRPTGTTRWSRIEQVVELSQDSTTDPEPPLSLLPLILKPERDAEPIASEPAPPATREPVEPDAASTVDFGVIEPAPSSATIEATPVFTSPPASETPGVPRAAQDRTAPPLPEPSLPAKPEPRARPEVEPDDSIEATPVFAQPSPAEPVAPRTNAPVARPDQSPTGVTPRESATAAGPALESTLLPDDEDGVREPAQVGDLVDLAPTELEGPTANSVEDEDAASFTLSRGQTERVEELDLAAMVDVAFQLVLFFLVTASTVVFKTLEIPKPSEDKPPEVAAQSRAKTVEELEKDFILVEIDAEGNFRVDHLPVVAERSALTEKLRQARETTGRKALLLATDPATRHRVAVLATDVASEINLEVSWAKTAAP